jgi:inositol transporter-like SP family MFS transporter
VIVGVARLTCGLLAFVTPVLLSAGPVVLYCLLTAIVAIGMVIGWLCFHGKQRNEFNAETEMVATSDNGQASHDTLRAKA